MWKKLSVHSGFITRALKQTNVRHFSFAIIGILLCAHAAGQTLHHVGAIDQARGFSQNESVLGGAQRRFAILIDRTDSMNSPGPGGVSRCAAALRMAREELNEFSEEFVGSTVAVYGFAQTTTPLTAGFVSPAVARNALNSLSDSGCSGLTALADALCDVGDALAAQTGNIERQILVLTDGGENSSNPGRCGGSSSSTNVAPFAPNSWHNKVYTKFTEPLRPISLNKYMGGTVLRSPLTLAADSEQRSPTNVQTDIALFRATAEQSGGVYATVPDNQPIPPPFFPSPPLLQADFEPLASRRLFEQFESVITVVPPDASGNCTLSSALSAGGWSAKNISAPRGGTCVFSPSATPPFLGFNGSYAAFNYNSTTPNGTISTWFVSPVIPFGSQATLEFYIRRIANTTTVFPDRLEVRFSTNSVAPPNVGVGPFDVGSFSNLLLSINPILSNVQLNCPGNGYSDPSTKTIGHFPQTWCKIRLTNMSGIPRIGSGRFAFRYFVTNGGDNPAPNSDYIGLDQLSYSVQ